MKEMMNDVIVVIVVIVVIDMKEASYNVNDELSVGLSDGSN